MESVVSVHQNGHVGSHKREGCLVGLDIGGTKTAVLVTDMNLKTIGFITAETDVSSPEALMTGLRLAIEVAVAGTGLTLSDVRAIGAGIPGQVDPETGMVRMAVNLNLSEYPLGSALTKRFGVPVRLENDVRLAAVGAHARLQSDSATPIHNLAYLSIGTGIAAGLILNDQLFRGSSGMAGEIGHAIVDPHGELCGCGCRGCLETIASGPAITRQAAPILAAEGLVEPFFGEQVFELAQDGHPDILALLDRVGDTLARAIQMLVMSYDVEKVVLSGGVVNAGAPFLDPIWRGLAALRAESNLAATMLPPEKFIVWPAKDNAGTWGAILLAQQAEWALAQGLE